VHIAYIIDFRVDPNGHHLRDTEFTAVGTRTTPTGAAITTTPATATLSTVHGFDGTLRIPIRLLLVLGLLLLLLLLLLLFQRPLLFMDLTALYGYRY